MGEPFEKEAIEAEQRSNLKPVSEVSGLYRSELVRVALASILIVFDILLILALTVPTAQSIVMRGVALLRGILGL